MKFKEIKMPAVCLAFCFLTGILFSVANAQQLAFPGAEGFGKYTRGGRGGIVVEVTNLNDAGAGSLRDALTGPSYKGKKRTVVFKVSGTIELMSSINISNDSCITIAGQTAPGGGICIRNYPVSISDSRQIIIRYIRSRLGDQQSCVSPNCDIDAFSIRKSHHIILDHCSFSWSIDAILDLTVETGYSTVQYCILSEALMNSKHSKGGHSMAAGWDGNSHGDHGIFAGGSYHHNLIASCNSRTPRLDAYAGENNKGLRDLIDVVNNVIYNWSSYGAYGGEFANVNWQNNYYKYGPNTGKKDQIFQPDGACKMFVSGNYTDGYPSVTSDNSKGIYVGGTKATASQLDTILKSSPFAVESINLQTAEAAFDSVLKNAGAILPARDQVDERIISDVKNRTGKIIDSQNQVGGWPTLQSGTPPADTDKDGMPDSWEIPAGLNPSDPGDRNGDKNQNGYTDLEDYLNGISISSGPNAVNAADFKNFNFQVYPNPVNDQTIIEFQLNSNSKVGIKITDTKGGAVSSGYEKSLNPGIHQIPLKDLVKTILPAGLYFCQITVDGHPLAFKLFKN